MAEKKVKTIRLPQPQAERVEEIAEERDMSEADTYREVIRSGIEVEEEKVAREGRPVKNGLMVDSFPDLVYKALTLALLVAILANEGGVAL